MKTVNQRSIAAVLIAITSVPVLAAFNPPSATTGSSTTIFSQGSAKITAQIEHAVRVSDLQDMDFGNITFAATNPQVQQEFCVFANTGGNYSITFDGATGDNPASAGSAKLGSASFLLANNAADTLAYTVEFKNGVGGGSFQSVAAGSANNASGADSVSIDCATGGIIKPAVRLTILAADIPPANPGDYVGTLYVIVSPR